MILNIEEDLREHRVLFDLQRVGRCAQETMHTGRNDLSCDAQMRSDRCELL